MANAKPTTADDVIAGLKARGFKLTGARRAMVEVFCAGAMPVTAAELLAAIAEKGGRADRTTVYREVQFLLEQGVVEETHFGDGAKRYELAEGGHHHHLVCEQCGDAVDVPLENDLAAAEKAIARRTGYAVTRHALEFFGVCPSCR
jgi:Fur family ferric uptake transcriptional regulator